jgi:hypothetical protein
MKKRERLRGERARSSLLTFWTTWDFRQEWLSSVYKICSVERQIRGLEFRLLGSFRCRSLRRLIASFSVKLETSWRYFNSLIDLRFCALGPWQARQTVYAWLLSFHSFHDFRSPYKARKNWDSALCVYYTS